MSNAELIKVAAKIKNIAGEVRKHLGCGFPEEVFQRALAIELRNNGIDYLKEVNVEVFYKGESVGVDRPDFVITKAFGCTKPIILETKVLDRYGDDTRAQLKSYCISLPRNNNPVLTDFIGGFVLCYPKCDVGDSPTIKTCVVDTKFNILVDDQADEDEQAQLEKEKERQAKELAKAQARAAAQAKGKKKRT